MGWRDLKAWIKGAFVGLVITLLTVFLAEKLLNIVFGGLVYFLGLGGTLIGGAIGYLIKSEDMKSWKSGGILGFVWGILSFLSIFLILGGEYEGPLWIKLLTLPMLVSYTIISVIVAVAKGITSFYIYYFLLLLVWPLLYLGPLVFGTVLGVIVGHLYGRWKEK